jgi:hypothetical protein
MQKAPHFGSEHPAMAPVRASGLPMNLEVNLETLSSVTLARLVEEVRNEDLPAATKYDRTYNRHNR